MRTSFFVWSLTTNVNEEANLTTVTLQKFTYSKNSFGSKIETPELETPSLPQTPFFF